VCRQVARYCLSWSQHHRARQSLLSVAWHERRLRLPGLRRRETRGGVFQPHHQQRPAAKSFGDAAAPLDHSALVLGAHRAVKADLGPPLCNGQNLWLRQGPDYQAMELPGVVEPSSLTVKAYCRIRARGSSGEFPASPRWLTVPRRSGPRRSAPIESPVEFGVLIKDHLHH